MMYSGPPAGAPITGVVNSWKTDRGFGFIQVDAAYGGGTVFAHHSDLGGGRLVQGRAVTFMIALSQQGKQKAVHIKGPGVLWGKQHSDQSAATPAGVADAEQEATLSAEVERRLSSGDIEGGWQCVLRLRELWLGSQRRLQERPGLDFHSFQKPYMKAFGAFRSALGPAQAALLPQRRWVDIPAGRSGAPAYTFRALTLNVLSQKLLDVFAYQSVVVPPGAGDFMTWESRCPLIVEEIKRWDCHLVALQELDVDKHDELQHALEGSGLMSLGVFPRGRMSGTPAKDGVCLLYKTSLFTRIAVHAQSVHHEWEGAMHPGGVAVAASFVHRPSGQLVTALCTHVTPSPKAKEGFGSSIQKWTTNDSVVGQLLHAADNASSQSHGEASLVLMGDLNGLTPDGAEALSHYGLGSAYAAAGADGMEKWEGALVTSHNDAYHWGGELDMILCRGLQVRKVLQIPEHPTLRPQRSAEHAAVGLPMPGWPSDHVSLVAEFEMHS
eukprot:Hpha_TRINITY_DN3621_c0_g1::TRINITY_DN3621_c0_g1_i1::g.1155::m.1155